MARKPKTASRALAAMMTFRNRQHKEKADETKFHRLLGGCGGRI